MANKQLSCSQLVFRLGLALQKRLEVFAYKDPQDDELLVKWLESDNPLGGAWVCSTEMRTFLPHRGDPGFVERLIELRVEGRPCGLCETNVKRGCTECAQALCKDCSMKLVMGLDFENLLVAFKCPFCRTDLSWISRRVAETRIKGSDDWR